MSGSEEDYRRNVNNYDFDYLDHYFCSALRLLSTNRMSRRRANLRTGFLFASTFGRGTPNTRMSDFDYVDHINHD